MNTMTYEEISKDSRYELIDTFELRNLKHFILEEMEKNGKYGPIGRSYQMIGALALILGAFKAFMPLFKSWEFTNIWYFLGGIGFSFTLLLLVHEAIHAIAMRLRGYKRIKLYGSMKYKCLCVSSINSAISGKDYLFICLAPLVSVAALSLLGMILCYSHPLFYLFLAIFAIHSLFCAGDIGFSSYIDNRKDHSLFIVDDFPNGKSYIFTKK